MGATSRLGGPTIFGEPRPQPVDTPVDNAPVTQVVAGPEVAAEGRLAAGETTDIDSLPNQPAAVESPSWFDKPGQ